MRIFGPSVAALAAVAAIASVSPAHAQDVFVGNGGEESVCGWCKDKWGLSWQITPIALSEAITDSDPAVAKRAFDAMMEMGKIDIAKIEAARRG
jgi:predicted 3-demethylubiquinone-9 3-methyltransferase (glyoxalase superfamily)